MTRGPSADDRREQIRQALRGRPLYWFGIRGSDAAPYLPLPEFSGSFCITSKLAAAGLDERDSLCLEEMSGERVDLDMYDIDLDRSDVAGRFRDRLLDLTNRRCVLVTYRPSSFVSALGFALNGSLSIAGMFKDRQAAFEHKPWVETAVAQRGVPTLECQYISDHHQRRAERMLRNGPLVLRTSRDSGGVGIHRVSTAEELHRRWPSQPEHFVAVAPFLEDALPLNVSGCVFRDGTVRLHPPSVQLIGVDVCTDRPFGYCGNDFGAIKNLPEAVIAQLERMVRKVGKWLRSQRYLGAFGVDALVHDGKVRFTEVNPRFQGSSSVSSAIAGELHHSDLHLDHLAAFLRLDPQGRGPRLVDWVAQQPAIAQAVVHNTSGESVTAGHRAVSPVETREAVLGGAPGEVKVAPGGVLGRVTFRRSITQTGYEVTAEAKSALTTLQSGGETVPR